MQNFTVVDLVQTTLAILAFSLFLVPPGYLLCVASNMFGLRRCSGSEKLLYGVAFSIAVTPLIAVLLTRFFSYPVTLGFFVLLAVMALGTVLRRVPQIPALLADARGSTWLLFGLTAAWFLVVQFSLADLQIGRHLYVNYVIYDHSVRVPFVEAAVRAGVPPQNPFYGLGQAPVLRYFYYWYVVCALPVKLFGLSPKACLDASAFWSGLGVAALIPLFLKHFLGEREGLRTKSLIGIGLLSVTGLDLLAYAAWAGYYRVWPPDMEWWDNNQVTSWVGSLLWVPHHVASMAACMAGLLALCWIDEDSLLRDRVWAVLIAGLAFASAAGLSIYVVFPFAVFLVFWTVATVVENRLRTFVTFLATGAVSLLLSWPYLHDLLSKSAAVAAGGSGAPAASGGERFAFLSIRDFTPGVVLLTSLGIRAPFVVELAKVLMLVGVYAVEFGIFAVALYLYWRRDRQSPGASPHRRMGWALFIVCLLVLSFVKSDTSGSNDLGFRGMLVVQFVLLLWATVVIYDVFFAGDRSARAARWMKPALIGTLVVGVAGTALQLALLRGYAPLADAGDLTRSERTLGSPGFGERTYWIRQGFAQLDQITPRDTTIQYNPVRDDVLVTHFYSPRQAGMGDAYCGSAFGGDTDRCRQVFPLFAAVFNDPDAVRGWDLDRFCDDFHVNVLVATDADPVWSDHDSWVWVRRSMLANSSMRAVGCGSKSLPLATAEERPHWPRK